MSKLDKEALASLDSMRELMDNADCLISQQEVERALDRMAEAITRDLGDKLPVFYCVMNGGLITTGHLLTRLGFPLEGLLQCSERPSRRSAGLGRGARKHDLDDHHRGGGG